MKSNDIIFKTNHIPAMQSGAYQLSAGLQVMAKDAILEKDILYTQEFDVAGNRFNLNPLDIQTIFPAPESTGDHSNTLPHISLKRSTIPWEWDAYTNGVKLDQAKKEVPWLCLLVLAEDDGVGGILTQKELNDAFYDKEHTLWKELIARGWIAVNQPSDTTAIILSPSSRLDQTLSAGYIVQKDEIETFLNKKRSVQVRKLKEVNKVDHPNLVYWKSVSMEAFEKPEDQFSYVDIDSILLDKVIPLNSELTHLTHVRETVLPDETQTDHIFVIGNRLPTPGEKCTVHLISLEGRYNEDGKFIYKGDNTEPIPASAPKLIRLVTLKHWDFYCVDQKKNLIESLKELNTTTQGDASHTLQLPNDGVTNTTVKSYLEQGFVPLPHSLREGSQSVSWMRGPLINSFDKQGLIDTEIDHKVTEGLVTCADELTLFEPELNMLNVAYSSAWELGRMLLLNESDLAQEMFQWKRQKQQELHKAEQLIVKPHLPFHDQTDPPMGIPEKLGEWLDQLRLLEHIPFNYLISDERLLPKESLRFFQLDERWIEALLDGVFSIGRVPYGDQFKEKANAIPNLTGILIRSDVVSNWPDILIDGYSVKPDSTNLDGNLEDNQLRLLRIERLTEDILFCIFDGKVVTVDIHLKPETVHFGYNRPANHDINPVCHDYFKDLRDLDGTEAQKGHEPIPVAIAWKNKAKTAKEANRVIDVLAQGTNFKDAQIDPPNGYPNAAEFALQMIEGVPKVRFITS